jgi:hypothetical protein
VSVPLGREAIWSALFGLLTPLQASPPTSNAPFATVSRRAINFEAVASVQQPALYVMQRREHVTTQGKGLPPKWVLHGEIFIYVANQPDQIAAGSGGGQALNPLIDAVEKALAPVLAQGNVQSLGGLVSRAFIDGEVEIFEGNIINQAVAIIPLTIVATGGAA